MPNYVAQTKQWRWQISAQPRWSSSNRKSASEALEHWYQVHGRKILDESRQKIAQMQRTPVEPPEEPAAPQAQHLNLGSPLTWEQLQELAAHPIPCWRTLSQDSLIAMQELAKLLLEQDDLHFAHLMMLPKLILWHVAPKEETNPKVKSRTIAERIRLAPDGQWAQLHRDALAAANWEIAQPLPAVGHTFGDAHLERLLRAASHGEGIGKAWKQLLQGGAPLHMPQAWADTSQLLKPRGDSVDTLPSMPTAAEPPCQLNLKKALKQLKLRKGADAGGWCSESLQQVFHDNKHLRLLQAQLTCVAFSTPDGSHVKTFMHTARAVILPKPGSGVRPILIGSIFQKLLALQLKTPLLDHMPMHIRQRQYALGTSSGAAAMALQMDKTMKQEGRGLLQLDMKNAFGTLRREETWRLLTKYLAFGSCREKEKWHAWLSANLKQPTTILWSNKPERCTHSLESCDGLAQGDALSSCIFGLTVACMLEELCQQCPTLQAYAYMDDIVLDAPVEDYEDIFQALQSAMQSLGLSLNYAKCKAWWGQSNPQTLPTSLWQHRGQVLREGLVTCGLPTRVGTDEELAIGSTEFLEEWLRDKTSTLKQEMQLLQELVSIGDVSGRPTLQVAMTLLKAVYPAKVMHLQRCYSHEQLAEMQEELQQTSQRLIAAWLQEERLTAGQWQVASLPPHMGGTGSPELATARTHHSDERALHYEPRARCCGI